MLKVGGMNNFLEIFVYRTNNTIVDKYAYREIVLKLKI